MKNFSLLVILGIFASILSGCETTSTRPYEPSTQNVLKFQGALLSSDTKIKLGNFTESKAIGSLVCRLSGPVDVSPGKSRAEYIKEAMQSELFMARAYDVGGDLEISGSLDSLKFSSVAPASWTIEFKIFSNISDGYTVKTNYPFRTSFSAFSACRNVADAWSPAIQQLIQDIVDHPKFNELVGLYSNE